MNTTIKKYLIGTYVIITLILSVFYNIHGRTATKPYSYNLGQAVVWPISLIVFHTL